MDSATEPTSNDEATVELKFDAIIIRFKGLIHLRIRRSRLLGIRSWRYGPNNYYIEFSMEGGTKIRSDYNSKEKWMSILAGLENVFDG
jgi:hypothetical protein